MGNTENRTTEAPPSAATSSEQQQEQAIHEEEEEEEQQQQREQEEEQDQDQEDQQEKQEERNNSNVKDDIDIHDVVSVLRCGACKYPLCLVNDILAHRAHDAWMAHVYAYELDLFTDNTPLWCYSATNPAARRFDIIRCKSSYAMRLRGPWSREHSFFIGHEWCYCSCRNCNHFLGWGFRLVQSSNSNSNNSNNKNSSNNNSRASSYTSILGEDGRGETVEEEENEKEHEANDKEEEEETEEEEEKEEKEEKCGLMIEPEGVLFVGLILTHCVGDEKFPRQIYETLQNMCKTFRGMEGLGFR
ncbi:hypothetical protein LSM04_008180 [Trypanosoma melophagium]|uniref:uncharacterized protein n=1 Tax=Trypanosoma melophagium TaxID=715481 RepID=UPI00351A5DC4|nr:hypothetical protein LSM04_008180 [Trypanosoma melophagium]